LRILASTIFTSLFLYTGAIQANHVKAFGYEINYSAFSAGQIDNDLVLRHKLGFSKKDIVVNINILPKQKLDKVMLNGSAKTLFGEITGLNFKKILEGNTVFYLASLEKNEEDFVSFDIEIMLPDRQKIPIKFVRRYD
tara:strand:+ start:154 stop:567 length:414 start_codon:yes stop_codon:yes gene_type:complete